MRSIFDFLLAAIRNVLLAFLLLTVCKTAVASGRVTFCFNDWPPYTQMTNEGATGITVEIIKQAAKLLDRQIQFVEREWDVCLKKVEAGDYDVVLDAAKRDAYLQGPTSFNLYADTFWVSNRRDISRYDQLTGGKIGLVKGYNYSDSLLKLFDKLKLKVVRGKDDPSNIRELANGQLDAVIADLASTFDFTRKNDLEVHPILPPYSFDRLYPAFNKNKAGLQREFDEVLARLLENGFVDQVYMDIIGTSYSSFSNIE